MEGKGVLNSNSNYEQARRNMVEYQIKARGIKDKRVLSAMLKVPRHLFVPEEMKDLAYRDEPLPIGYSQTISQPYIVAYMTEALKLRPEDKVLEIGTGSGYQTAILAELVREVYTIEIIPELSQRAEETLKSLGYTNIEFLIGDGSRGWPEKAPFDAILVSAAPAEVPPALVDQLQINGRLILPVGTDSQELVLIKKTKKGLEKTSLIGVRFVPLIIKD
ncbi:MAG TPA: protein-L-isoaspartate(D-aspartate) O-methyltransferase [Candidatus Saccharicenans sp.]|nr:protein-L-isoaspartate(D-aspartate) O-methyltransferase [Candidatus Saccharicenans sp.]HPU93477.1 protein-L-isoaspartate(D-aspartate) O-methyltransferase [Candidatus Saccharicenans sp.]